MTTLPTDTQLYNYYSYFVVKAMETEEPLLAVVGVGSKIMMPPTLFRRQKKRESKKGWPLNGTARAVLWVRQK